MATNEDVEKRPGLRRLGANARIALGLMYESSRRDTIAITGLTVLQAAVPTLILLAERSLINNVADRAGTSGADVLVFSVILLGAAWALMATLSDALDNIQVFAASRLKSWVLLRGQQRLLEKNATYASLDLHENPDRLNEQGLAQTGVGGVISLTWSLFQVATALLALLPLAILLATIGWWIPLVMLLAMGPNIYLTMSSSTRVDVTRRAGWRDAQA